MSIKINRVICIAGMAAVLLGIRLQGQTTTTNTNCTVSGGMANCTSTSTDNSAQQQQAYQTGQAAGYLIGKALMFGISKLADRHPNSPQAIEVSDKDQAWIKNYCFVHPGEGWYLKDSKTGVHVVSGQCPTDEDRALTAVYAFMSRHHDYIAGPQNSQKLTEYLQVHRFDPREEKSYERAYKDLKKSGQLQLYAKS